MGMFDTIEWEADVPLSPEMEQLGLPKSGWDFQTKDFGQNMEHYVVTNGRLHTQKYTIDEWVAGDPNAKSYLDRFGYRRREDPYLNPDDRTDTFSMYTHLSDVDDKWDCWIEYDVVVIGGDITSVTLTEFRKESNERRKEAQKALADSILRNNRLWYNRFFFHRRYYQIPARYVRLFLLRFSESLSKIAYKMP